MRETFRKKLDKLKSFEERAALKELIEAVLLPMAEYQEEKWEEIKNRVFDEARAESGYLPIVMGLCTIGEYDPAHNRLFPVLPPETLDLASISAMLSEGHPIELFSVYLDEPWERLSEIFANDRSFKAVLRTNKGEMRASCKLRRDERFSAVLRDLYGSFVLHGIPWKTVHNVYTHRMARVILTDAAGLPESETLTEISVDFEDTIVKHDMLPLWNIETLSLKGTGFAIPFEEKVLFEHRIRFSDADEAANFLIGADASIRSVKRVGTDMILLADASKNREWNVYKITTPKIFAIDKESIFPLFSNETKMNFTAFAASGIRVFTYAELLRHIESFGFPLTAEDIQITNETRSDEIPGTMNFELDVAFSQINDTKTMRVVFSAADAGSYMPYIKDMVAFLMSELQIICPQYKCAGVFA
jgi:hypothetical protein